MGVVVATTGREYWQALLGAGGFTAVPRWTRDPTTGVAEHQEPIPEELAAALYRLASSAALPLSSLLLAAHAKVLAARRRADAWTCNCSPDGSRSCGRRRPVTLRAGLRAMAMRCAP
jgi:hypothetical protein